jgi:hypothetical protein
MRLLDSPRRRRRLMITTIVVAVAAPLIYLGVHFSSSGSPQNANGPYVNDDSFYREPKHVPFTAAKRRAVRKVLARFIASAVARRHVADSWELAGPALRQNVTRDEWRRGDIPIVPYPAAAHGQGAWDLVHYSYKNRVGLEVLLFPKPASGYSIATVDTDLLRGRDGRWRVDYWMITKFHGPGATAPADSASALSEGPGNVHKLPKNAKGKKHRQRQAARAEAAPRTDAEARVDRKWVVLLLALLSLVVVIPLAIGTGIWIRNQRAAAAYRRSR